MSGPERREHSDEYRAYMASDRWRALRRWAIDRAGGRCRRCLSDEDDSRRFGGGSLEVHHKTYDRLGKERWDDIEVLCPPCHKVADAEREKETEARGRAALHEARLDGWATKVFGEDWESREDPGYVEQRFYDWLATRGEEE